MQTLWNRNFRLAGSLYEDTFICTPFYDRERLTTKRTNKCQNQNFVSN